MRKHECIEKETQTVSSSHCSKPSCNFKGSGEKASASAVFSEASLHLQFSLAYSLSALSTGHASQGRAHLSGLRGLSFEHLS